MEDAGSVEALILSRHLGIDVVEEDLRRASGPQTLIGP
jgi:hypothetical protein